MISDSSESFEKEVSVFFPNFNSSHWYEYEEPKFKRGECEFDFDNFIHVI